MVSMVHAEARLLMGRAAARWATRASLGSGAAPRYRRAGLLRDHWPKPHSGNDARRCGGSATRRRAVDERARAPACYPTSAHGALRIAHAHMHTHTHVHVHVRAHVRMRMRMRMRVRVRVLASRRASGERAQAHLRVKGGLTAASQVALACGHRSGHGCSQGHSRGRARGVGV